MKSHKRRGLRVFVDETLRLNKESMEGDVEETMRTSEESFKETIVRK